MRGLLVMARAHPVITGLMLSCILSGALIGGIWLPEEWLIVRRVAAGAFMGAWVGLLIAAPRMLGS